MNILKIKFFSSLKESFFRFINYLPLYCGIKPFVHNLFPVSLIFYLSYICLIVSKLVVVLNK